MKPRKTIGQALASSDAEDLIRELRTLVETPCKGCSKYEADLVESVTKGKCLRNGKEKHYNDTCQDYNRSCYRQQRIIEIREELLKLGNVIAIDIKEEPILALVYLEERASAKAEA
jgi:hypothetical protein